MSDGSTIYALSSGAGRAGLAVIRVSGPQAGVVLSGLLGGSLPAPRRATRGRLRTPESGVPLDDGLVLWFPGPGSFTGEDVAELHVHGGPAVIAAVLSAVSGFSGTRLAEPGEFSRQAFLNDKMDLTGAEGLVDLIEAETEAQRLQALRQAAGALGAVYSGWRKRLMSALAHMEAAIDFPDEDLPTEIVESVNSNILSILNEMTQHLDDGRVGERLRAGIEIAIVGPPNAGKSSLLNVLAGRDAAIVSEMSGTTRDVVEVRMDLAGFPVVLCDTAGIRAAEDVVEAEGVRRARERASTSDIRIAVFDLSDPAPPLDSHFELPNTLTILNKSDLADGGASIPAADLGVFRLSAHTGEGVEAFVDALSALVSERFDGGGQPIITRARHREAVSACRAALARGLEASLPELVAEDLRLGMRALARITGAYDVEDLLDIVFRDFCIGK